MRMPKIVISKCLGFENCRYNGQSCSSKPIESLNNHVEFLTVCPEVGIGLKTPRESIRIIEDNKNKRLIQQKSNIDHTDNMQKFCKDYIDTIDDVDGFILKSKSPSCGINDVTVYHKNGMGSLYGGSSGFFAEEVIKNYSHLPIENEGRLRNYKIRDEFLTKLFTINNFKHNKNNLKDFQSKNSELFKMYDTNQFYELQKLASKSDDKNIKLYENKLYEILQNNRSSQNNIKTLIDIYNKYEKNLSMKEKEIFVDNVVKYSKGKMHFSTLLNNIKLYAARFEDEYILNQSIFSPYPESLLDISDSGKGIDI